MSSEEAPAAVGTSQKSKERLGKMLDGFSEFEGIMKDATRVRAPAPGCRFPRPTHPRPEQQSRCCA
jgi:hypothetical protein